MINNPRFGWLNGFLTVLGNADDRFGEQFLFGNVALRGDSADFGDDAGPLFLHQSNHYESKLNV